MLELHHITFACDDPQRLAEFWAQVLDGYRAEPSGERWRAAGEGLDLSFNRRQKSPTIELPIHVDFRSDDREAEIERLLDSGATLVKTKTDPDRTWTVMRDPEGNPFCVE